MPPRKKYDKQITLSMTTEMYNNLLRLAGQRRKVPDLVRKFVRHGLDEQGEIAGSRRYFTGRFRDQVNLQRLEMRWFFTVFLLLLSQGLSLIILGLYPDMADEDKKKFSGPALFKTAVAQAEEQGSRILETMDDLVLDKSLGED